MIRNGGNKDMAKMFQELRRSNATVPIPSGKKYNRSKSKRAYMKEFA